MSFSWVPFYGELARKVANFREKPEALAQLLVAVLQGQGMSVDWLRDKDVEGRRFPLKTMDPFTFFAAFNRGITNENRIGLLSILKQRLDLSAAVPSDFDGIPVVDNRNAWFFKFFADRKPDAVDNLWALFHECHGKSVTRITPETYEKVVEAVGVGKTTMGLYWVNPNEYLALDAVNLAFLGKRLDEAALAQAATHSGYVAVIKTAKSAFPGKRFCEVSYDAWTDRQERGPAHWVLALGEGSKYWEDCQSRGIVRVGWNGMATDLGGLNKKQLKEVHSNSKEGDLKGIEDFVFSLKPGDLVFIKQGVSRIIGYGEITGDYVFEQESDTYRHTRSVKWMKKGAWDLADGAKKLPQKTLTEVGDQERVDELLKLIGWPPPPIAHPGRNIILYGPPGTGKTYELQQTYFPRFTEKKTKTKENYIEEIVSDLSWWEIVATVVYDMNRPKVSVSEILAHPLMAAKVRLSNIKHSRSTVWGTLQTHTKEDCLLVKYSKRLPPLVFSKEPDSTWTLDRLAVENEFPDLVDVPKQLQAFTPVVSEVRRYKFVTFHQSFSYEDFVEGIKPVVRTTAEGEEAGARQGEIAYAIKPGVFRELAEKARKDPAHDYALFIDEINRGNVANIFGELITLIEEDKRLPKDMALDSAKSWTVTLPYSRQLFGVPEKLYIIGTMNTADRGIEALDTALRRRFSFVPTYPNPELLRGCQPQGLSVDLARLLQVMNERLEILLDKDHTIGHSYLMKVRDADNPLDGLRQAFANSILPLLQEFFYGNPSRIAMVLGSSFVRKRSAHAKLAKGDWDAGEAEEKEVYEITPPGEWTAATFESVYA